MGQQTAPTFQCEFCNKITPYRPSMGKDGRQMGWQKKQRFCSKDCGYASRKWRPINPNGYIHANGYRRLHFRGGKKRYQHTVFMEQFLGRPLHKHENVHHKNGDRLDNSIKNLELWSKMQPPGQRVADKVQFAIEMLALYPEFARQAGYVLHKIDHEITDEKPLEPR